MPLSAFSKMLRKLTTFCFSTWCLFLLSMHIIRLLYWQSINSVFSKLSPVASTKMIKQRSVQTFLTEDAECWIKVDVQCSIFNLVYTSVLGSIKPFRLYQRSLKCHYCTYSRTVALNNFFRYVPILHNPPTSDRTSLKKYSERENNQNLGRNKP